MATSTTTTTSKTTTTSSAPKPRIRRISETRYLIESTSTPGLGRQVDVQSERCSCPAGRYGRRCRHLAMAQRYHTWRQEQLALSLAQQREQAKAARPGETGMAALQAAFGE